MQGVLVSSAMVQCVSVRVYRCRVCWWCVMVRGVLMQDLLVSSELVQGVLIQGVLVSSVLVQGALMHGVLASSVFMQGVSVQGVLMSSTLVQGTGVLVMHVLVLRVLVLRVSIHHVVCIFILAHTCNYQPSTCTKCHCRQRSHLPCARRYGFAPARATLRSAPRPHLP